MGPRPTCHVTIGAGWGRGMCQVASERDPTLESPSCTNLDVPALIQCTASMLELDSKYGGGGS